MATPQCTGESPFYLSALFENDKATVIAPEGVTLKGLITNFIQIVKDMPIRWGTIRKNVCIARIWGVNPPSCELMLKRIVVYRAVGDAQVVQISLKPSRQETDQVK